MKINNIRSPYIVEINGDSAQKKTKLELYIWRSTETEPEGPTKTLIKDSYSNTQYINYYNISPYIEAIYNNDIFLNSRVKRYYSTDGISYIYDDTESEYFIFVNGYKVKGLQRFDHTCDFAVLYNNPLNYTEIYKYNSSFYPTIDFIFDFNIYDQFRIIYKNRTTDEDVKNEYEDYGIIAYRIPLTISYFANDIINAFQIEYLDSENNWQRIFDTNVKPICENKYIPYQLGYYNSLGGWQYVTLFKKSTTTIDVKASEFNINQFNNYPNFDYELGQKKVFNKNGTMSLKLNTGFVAEEFNIMLRDIYLSEKLTLQMITYDTSELLINHSIVPVILKNTNTTYKTNVNDKLINYEFDFEIANNLIDNIV